MAAAAAAAANNLHTNDTFFNGTSLETTYDDEDDGSIVSDAVNVDVKDDDVVEAHEDDGHERQSDVRLTSSPLLKALLKREGTDAVVT